MVRQGSVAPAASAEPELTRLADELIARMQAGEPFDWSAAEREHPEYVERLRALAPALEALGELSHRGDAARSGAVPADELIPGVLGDFRILREVGRGGMGVVYEAEQVSLGRRVALKVLPFAATMDAKQLQRFKNEAKAAASLKHEHVVQVYGVGCERSVHFYAMEFVEGQTLAQLIAAMRGGSEPKAVAATAAYEGGPSRLPGGTSAAPPGGRDRPPDTAPVAALSTQRGGPQGRDFYRAAAGLIADAAAAR
jgi:hypothetical protein